MVPQSALGDALFGAGKGENFKVARVSAKGLKLEGPLPLPALDVEAAPTAGITFDLAVVAWYRSRWMSLTGRPPSLVMNDPSKWRPYTLDNR